MLEGHDDGLQVAGEFLFVLEEAERIEDELHERFQVGLSLEYPEDLELGAVKVLVTRTFLTSVDVFGTANFNAARRFEHVEVALDNDTVDFALVQNVLGFAAQTAYKMNQFQLPAVTAQAARDVPMLRS